MDVIAAVVLEGDCDAFEDLMRRYGAMVVTRVKYHVPPDALEETVQEVFLKAYKALATCRERDRFKAWLSAITWKGPAENPDDEYPLVLTTGRVLYQYHTGTMTRRSEVLEESAPAAYVEMNPADADNLGLEDGEMARATSRRGSIEIAIRVTDRVEKGLVFIPFHYKEASVNLLTNDALDPQCKIPEAKVCAIKVEKLLMA